VDEFAWMAASLDYQGCYFVTIGLDKVEFRKSVKGGTILKFKAQKTKAGNTSVQYYVSVYSGKNISDDKNLIFSTNVTFVRINKEGKKIPLPT
jgi:acyl-CoA hydrolase